MKRGNPFSWLAVALLLSPLVGCGKKGLIGTADSLVSTSQEIASKLESVTNAETAKAAIPTLEKDYPRVRQLTRELFERGRAAEKDGGLSESTEQTLGERVASFQEAMEKTRREYARLARLHGLPIEFWNVLRVERQKYQAQIAELQPAKLGPEGAAHAEKVAEMFDEYGPERVVTIALSGGLSSSNVAEIASKVKEKGGSSAKVEYASGDRDSVVVAPVDDFNKFVNGIDFGTVDYSDPAQRTLRLQVDRTTLTPDQPRFALAHEMQGPGAPGPGPPQLGDNRPPGFPGGRPASPVPTKPATYEEMVARHGKDHVVRFEIINFDAVGEDATGAMHVVIRATNPSAGYTIGGGKGHVGAVRDFDAFCKAIDFGEVVERDDLQKTIKIKADPKKTAAKAEEYRKSKREQDKNRKTPPLIAARAQAEKEAVASKVAAPAAAAATRLNALPGSSDPDYYKKLGELMVDPVKWTLKDAAVDALLRASPSDIKDPEVLKQIARNFRELAREEGHWTKGGKSIRGLVMYGGKFSVPILVDFLDRQTTGASPDLFDGLAALPDPRGAEALCRQLGNSFNHASAVNALRKMGPVAEDALIKAAPSNNAKVSLAAIQLLGDVGTEKSFELLGQAQKSRNVEVREAARSAVRDIRQRTKPAAGRPANSQ